MGRLLRLAVSCDMWRCNCVWKGEIEALLQTFTLEGTPPDTNTKKHAKLHKKTRTVSTCKRIWIHTDTNTHTHTHTHTLQSQMRVQRQKHVSAHARKHLQTLTWHSHVLGNVTQRSKDTNFVCMDWSCIPSETQFAQRKINRSLFRGIDVEMFGKHGICART